MNSLSKILKNELSARKKTNPSFSLRAFSKLLSVSPAQLSQLISGKRPLSPKLASKLAQRLNLSPETRLHLVKDLHQSLFQEDHSSAILPTGLELKDTQFQYISDWYHYAILSLGDTPSNLLDVGHISRHLGITREQATAALSKLKKLGLIEIKNGRFKQKTQPLTTSKDIPSEAIRKHHRQNLELAAQKIETIPTSEREFTSSTFAFDPERMPEAKQAIIEFRKKFSKTLAKGRRSSVYTIAIQFFPLTKKEN